MLFDRETQKPGNKIVTLIAKKLDKSYWDEKMDNYT